MLLVHKVPANVRIQVVPALCVPSPEVEAEITRLWDREVACRGETMFNGLIYSAVGHGTDVIQACVVEYRWLIAQRKLPDLFEILHVRPLAVSGLLTCADGVVFGLRSNNVFEAAGLWELVPSGGLDASVSPPDISSQIQIELVEELGLQPTKLSATTPFCLLEETESHLINLGVRLEAPSLTVDDIRSNHRKEGSPEYDEIQVIPLSQLPAAVASMRDGLLPVSRLLLRCSGLL